MKNPLRTPRAYALIAAVLLVMAATAASSQDSWNVSNNCIEIAGVRHLCLGGGTMTVYATTVVRTSQEFEAGYGAAKAGATAGWVVAAAANLYEVTLPQSQTASTLVMPVNGMHVGDTITAFKCEAQIESAGGAVTLDGNLRKLTNAAGDPVDASVGSFTQVAVTADTKAEPSKTALTEVVAADERFYILLTATTAASTDIRFLGCTVTTTTS